MRCEIDRGPVLRGEAPELVLGARRIAGLAQAAMEEIELAWKELNGEVAEAVDRADSCETQVKEAEGETEEVREELARAEREIERLRTLLKEYGIDPDEADDSDEEE